MSSRRPAGRPRYAPPRADGPATAPRPREREGRRVQTADIDAPALLKALLPLRFFLGLMFLYAGIDKLITPAFLQATGAGSIGEQLQAFTRTSPLTPLIQAIAVPAPVLIGGLMALAEIAIGLGATLGLFYRLSALGGAVVAFLFFLTASWSTRPIYYGPDLPYLAGWLTLVLIGRPGPFALDGWFERVVAERHGAGGGAGSPPGSLAAELEFAVPDSPERRTFLRLGLLATLTTMFGVAFALAGRLRSLDDGPASQAGSGLATAAPGGATGGSSTGATSAGSQIASLSQIQPGQSLPFTIPSGDPGILVRLSSGSVVAYDAICTHQGCTVGYDSGSGLLLCPCHGATFDPAHQAQVLGGPTNTPLASVPISVNQSTGAITISG